MARQLGVRVDDDEEKLVAQVRGELHSSSDSAMVKTLIRAAANKSPEELRAFVFGGKTFVEPEKSKIKVLGSISAGNGMQVIPLDDPREMEIEGSIDADWYALEVVGSSMDGGELPIKNGNLLVFEPSADAPNGWIIHAEWCEKPAEEPYCTVKKFHRASDGSVTLKPTNNDGYLPIVFELEDQQVEDFKIKGILRRHIQ